MMKKRPQIQSEDQIPEEFRKDLLFLQWSVRAIRNLANLPNSKLKENMLTQIEFKLNGEPSYKAQIHELNSTVKRLEHKVAKLKLRYPEYDPSTVRRKKSEFLNSGILPLILGISILSFLYYLVF
jgi:hypothetical protein